MPPQGYCKLLPRKTLGGLLDLPPGFAEQWEVAITKLRGPPSPFRQLADLTAAMREGADMATDILIPAPSDPAPAPPPPLPAPRRGRTVQHDWVAHTREAERFSAAYRYASGELPYKTTLLDHMGRWWRRQRTRPLRKVIARQLPRRLYSTEGT